MKLLDPPENQMVYPEQNILSSFKLQYTVAVATCYLGLPHKVTGGERWFMPWSLLLCRGSWVRPGESSEKSRYSPISPAVPSRNEVTLCLHVAVILFSFWN